MDYSLLNFKIFSFRGKNHCNSFKKFVLKTKKVSGTKPSSGQVLLLKWLWAKFTKVSQGHAPAQGWIKVCLRGSTRSQGSMALGQIHESVSGTRPSSGLA